MKPGKMLASSPKRTIVRLRVSNALCFLGLLATGHVTPASEDSQRAAVPQSQIERWVVELDSDQFAVRESAMKSLIDAGQPAIGPVVSAVSVDRKELTTRGIYVLQELAKCGDPSVEDKARSALETMAADQRSWVARRAGASLKAVNMIRQGRALKALTWLGAQVVPHADPFAGNPEKPSYTIHINDQWAGKDDDLHHLHLVVDAQRIVLHGSKVNDVWLDHVKLMENLSILSIVHANVTDKGLAGMKDVPQLRQLNVWYTPITDEAVEHLQGMKQTQQLVFYGTNITPEGADKLREQLAGVRVTVTNGAFLGVGASPNPQGCVINTIHPGSSAERAGLSVGDTITLYNGKPVPDFESLRDLIGQNRSGDEVEVKVLRGSEEVTRSVRLGEWDYKTFLL